MYFNTYQICFYSGWSYLHFARVFVENLEYLHSSSKTNVGIGFAYVRLYNQQQENVTSNVTLK